MNNFNNFIRRISATLFVSVGFIAWAHGLPLEISQVPLYAGGGAKPNVLFILDDSGSMQSAVMKTTDALPMTQFSALNQSSFLVAPSAAVDDFDLVVTRLQDGQNFYRGYSEDDEVILRDGAVLSTFNSGYWGTGYIDFPFAGGAMEWMFNSQPLGNADLTFHYANGSGATRYLNLSVDGIAQGTIAFPPTGGWATWGYVSQSIAVNTPSVKVVLTGGDYPGGPNVDSVYLNPRVEDAGLALVTLCPGFNALAFDPNKIYRPWAGQPNSTYPLAQKIPYQPGFGALNLSSARYVSWEDDGDGVYEFGECGAYISGGRVAFDTTQLRPVSNLSAAQRQNYANWYTYHRTREYAMKAGLSPVLEGLRVRAGLSTIHIHNQPGVNWGMNITDVDNFTNPTLQANKTALMDEFYEILSVNPWNFGGTPLRRSLENAGLYFQLENSSLTRRPETGFLPDVTTSPFLPANQGGACQFNHMVLLTDGYQFEYGGQGPRFSWGNVDAAVGGLHGDTLSNTMADIAMHFATTDAAPDIDGDQFVNTHAVSFGVTGNIDSFPATMAEKNWPTNGARLVGTLANPFEYPESLDDIVHAAFNGGGLFLTATDAISLNQEMNRLMNDIASSAYRGTATAVSFDRQGVAASTTMFQTLYDMSDWTGKLTAFAYDAATSTIGSEKWEASARLDLKNDTNPRTVITFNGVKGAVFKAPANISTPSLSAGELSAAQINDLLADRPAAATATEYLQDMIEYLRGDGDGFTTNAVFRERSSLGDIVHASPVYVGNPEGFYPKGFEAQPYSDFVAEHSSDPSATPAQTGRTPMVYAGANDGMLHGFNALTGDEVFAYIPKGVFSSAEQQGLHWLADDSYGHLPYVDETPVAGDVFIGGEWRTYLVGGLGRGGKSIYVLDVTDPASVVSESAMADEVVVSEFTDSTLGYTFGTPRIAKLVDGEWVAIFGNGYQNNTDGKAYLYVLYLDGRGPGGITHRKIGPLGTTGSVSDGYCEAAGSDCNGLSDPTIVDLNADGLLDRVYAGDLHGNLWAFDFTRDSGGALITARNPANVVPVVAHETASDVKVPLFTACRSNLVAGVCPAVSRQPITTKPTVAAHQLPSAGSAPNLMVYFGTGRYLGAADVLDGARQHFYGVWDSGKADGGLQPSDLTAQQLTTSTDKRMMSTVSAVEYLRKADAGGAGNYGWKVELDPFEKVVQNPAVVNSIVLFTTRLSSNDVCDQAGKGWLMGLDVFSGGKPAEFQVFPGNNADVGVVTESGGAPVRPAGSSTFYVPNAEEDIAPRGHEPQTEPKRAPKRSSWTNLK